MNYYEASVGKKENVGLKMMKRLGFVKGYGLGRKDDEGNCVGRLYPVHFKPICIGECREDGEVYQLLLSDLIVSSSLFQKAISVD